MGNKARRQPKRTATRKPLPPTLRLSVVVSPSTNGGKLSLAKELELVRSAVLFADEIEVVSPLAELLSSTTAFLEQSKMPAVELLMQLDEKTLKHFGGADLPPGWRDALTGLMLIDDETADVFGHRQLRDSFFEMAATTTERMRATFDELLAGSGGDELAGALRTGVVTMRPLFSSADLSSEALASAYFDELGALLRDARSHLLLDDATAKIARHLIAQGQVQPAPRALPNAWEAAVGTGVIARLPSFDQAPLDELLDVRRELKDPLGRYRRAVALMGQKMQASPFDGDASAEVDHLYRTEVQPSLEEIRDDLEHHSFVRELIRAVGSDTKSLVSGSAATGGLILLAAAVPDVATWMANAAAAAPTMAPAASVFSKAWSSSVDARREVRKHDLFYLHELNRRLS